MSTRYGILLAGSVLAYDHRAGREALYAHRRSAVRASRKLASWIPVLGTVRVRCYAHDDPSNPVANDLPTYVTEMETLR